MMRNRLNRLLSAAARRAGYDLIPHRNTMPIDSRFGLNILSVYFDKLVNIKPIYDIFLLHVGANDGINEDPVREIIHKYDVRAVLCEPLAKPFQLLEKNYEKFARVTCDRCAIGSDDGYLVVYTIDSAKNIENASVISSSQRSLVERWCRNWDVNPNEIREECVVQKTIPTILGEFRQKHVDVAVIDTEGMDAIICNQLLDINDPPMLLQFEYNNSPLPDINSLLKRLEVMGYRFARSGLDIIAARGQLAL